MPMWCFQLVLLSKKSFNAALNSWFSSLTLYFLFYLNPERLFIWQTVIHQDERLTIRPSCYNSYSGMNRGSQNQSFQTSPLLSRRAHTEGNPAARLLLQVIFISSSILLVFIHNLKDKQFCTIAF